MEYRIIPGTDLKVSVACLGTMTIGDQADSAAAAKAVDLALEHGVNFIDTADIYPRPNPTATENILGEILKPIRNRVILATKAGGPTGPLPGDRGLGRAHLLQAADDSLRRLQTDVIDLYYAHFPDPSTSPEELIETMNELIRAGKIRHYGISNFPAWQVCEIILKALQMNLQPPAATENVYNLVTRGAEADLIPMLKKYPMGLIAFNPLAGGLLSGKYTGGRMIEGTRFALEKGYADRYWSDDNLRAAAQIAALASEYGMKPLALPLQWLASREQVTSIILGFSRPEQLMENLALLEQPVKELPEDELDAIWSSLGGGRYNYYR